MSVAPEESKYMGNRMMERGYFATVFPDEGCLASDVKLLNSVAVRLFLGPLISAVKSQS